MDIFLLGLFQTNESFNKSSDTEFEDFLNLYKKKLHSILVNDDALASGTLFSFRKNTLEKIQNSNEN